MSRPPKPRLSTMRLQLSILKEIGAGPRVIGVAKDAIRLAYPIDHEYVNEANNPGVCHARVELIEEDFYLLCGRPQAEHDTPKPKPKVSTWTWAWMAWLLVFLCIEIPAAIKRKGATLSEHVWKWFGIRTKDKGYRWKRLVLAGFLIALSCHFVLDTSSIPVAVGGAGVLVVIGMSVLSRHGVSVQ
jgi:hypothetical protein